MKKSCLFIALASVAALGACDHYSERLAAMENDFPAQAPAPVSVTAPAPLQAYTPTTLAAAPAPAPMMPAAPQQQIDLARHDAALNAMMPAAGTEASVPSQPYNIALAQAYYDRAVQEKELMDHSAAHYYTTKAESALKGETPEPGYPADFGIERSDSAAMLEARAKLVQAIQAYKDTDKQASVVRAQVEFDGWLDQYAENKTGPALTSREGFIQAMEQLENPVAASRRYGVVFTPGQFVLSEGAQAIIDDAASFARENPGKPYTVSIVEKAPGPYSAQRLQAVQTALAAKGVPAGNIVAAAAPVPMPGAAMTNPQINAVQRDTVEIVVSFTGAAMATPAHMVSPAIGR